MTEKLVKAIHHTDAKAAEFISDKHRHLIRTGGSLPWRVFNCGNLVVPLNSAGEPAPKKTRGYIGFARGSKSNHYYFIFPDYATGRRELKASLLRKYKCMTLSQAIHVYAPPAENDTARYIRLVSTMSRVASGEVIGSLTDPRLEKLMDAMIQMEGYSKDEATRQEKWVNVTRIQATDGTRPIAGEEIVVKNGSQSTTLKSNSAGVFPPIVHSIQPVQVKHKTADGRLKDLGQLPTDEGAFLNLTTKVAEFFGRTGPVTPPAAAGARMQPFVYVVKQGDILGRLAKEFRTTVKDIALDNNLRGTKIFAGQRLGIHGPPPMDAGPVPVRQAVRSRPAAPRPGARPRDIPAAANPSPPHPATPPAVPGPSTPPPAPPPPPARPALTSHPAAPPPPVRAEATQPSAPPQPQQRTMAARSKQGKGEPLATFPTLGGIAPWMATAIEEAKRHRGADEMVINRTANYHKIIRTGSADLEAAWCAAFVSWNLWKAGYPFAMPRTEGYDPADVGRANGFRFVQRHVKKENETKKVKTYERNPLFKRIDKPVFGALAIVVNPGGHGGHVGFVYARANDNHVVVLGGNQGDTLKFSKFNVDPVKPGIHPITKQVIKGKRKKLEFYLPTSYTNPDSNGPEHLQTGNEDVLNGAAGIVVKASTGPESTR